MRMRPPSVLLQFQVAYFLDGSSDVGFQKYREAMTESGVVKNKPAKIRKIVVCDVDVKGTRRFRIMANVRQYPDFAR